MIRRIFILVSALFLLMQSGLVQAKWLVTAKDVINLHSAPPTAKLAYGKAPLQFGELRLPRTKGPYPVVIIIHGGCWLNKIAGLSYMSALSDALRDNGVATWNIEYNGVDNVKGGWPGTFNDVANATDYLRQIAKKYNLDLRRVIVIGHSAGGELALWLAARHNILPQAPLYTNNPLRIKGVIVLGGVPDIKDYRSQCLKVCGFDPIEKLVPNKKYYRQIMPSALLPLKTPQIFIYGAEDNIVPAKFSFKYIRAATRKGDIVKLILIKNSGHHEYNVPNSVVWPALQNAIILLYKKP